MNLFFEDSTRTRTTFELAAKRLSADVINIDIAASATAKGETLSDTCRTLEAMGADVFVVRHGENGTPHFIAREVSPGVAVVNAGDGTRAHPTQALLDMLTIRQHRGATDDLVMAIIGDIRHSRVAKSHFYGLRTLGIGELRVAGPEAMVPEGLEQIGVRPCASVEEALTGADIVMMLRIQRERMAQVQIPSPQWYFKHYGLSRERLMLADPDALVMHPGPINREVEIAGEVADGGQSLILEQVANGIAVRMAVLSMVVEGQAELKTGSGD